jgi:hypothetical protein
MLFISTADLVSVLALTSTLTGLVLADGPRPQCIGMAFISISPVTQRADCGSFGLFQRNIMFRKSPDGVPHRLFADGVLILVPRDGGNCTSIAQQAGVNQSTIQTLNPGINCTFFWCALQEETKLMSFFFW